MMDSLPPESIMLRAGGARSNTSLPHSDTEAPPDPKAPPAPVTRQIVYATSLQGVPVQPREWIVQDWLPVGCATINYGPGGDGKTLLAQQLLTSCATGLPWIGLATMQCRGFALFCEDDEKEVHRRQDRINAHHGIDFDALGNLSWMSGAGFDDNTLMRFLHDGSPVRTDLFNFIVKHAKEFGARLLLVDTAADAFGGNEVDRGQVRNFMGAMNRIAMQINGAVLVNAHPSRSGMSTAGDMDGGSTAWSNTARSRWSLVRTKAEEAGDEASDERILTRRKANYAAIGEAIKLRFSAAGVLVPTAAPGGLAAVAQSAIAEEVFLALLRKVTAENRPVSASSSANNSAATLFAKRPDRQGCSRRELAAAQERLFAAGRLTMEEYGRAGSNGRPRRIVEVPQP